MLDWFFHVLVLVFMNLVHLFIIIFLLFLPFASHGQTSLWQVSNGKNIKIARDMKNTGNRLPSCSCFFFAYLAKKKIIIIAAIIVVKKTSKFVQIGAGV